MREYYMPGSSVKVDVDYYMEDGEPLFESATINGEYLDCDRLFVIVDQTKKGDLVRRLDYQSLARYFQSFLDDDCSEIKEEYAESIAERRRELEEEI